MESKYILALIEMLHQENIAIMQTMFEMHLPPTESKELSEELENSWNKTFEEIREVIVGDISDSNDKWTDN